MKIRRKEGRDTGNIREIKSTEWDVMVEKKEESKILVFSSNNLMSLTEVETTKTERI